MKNVTIDNSISTQNVVLWQYDKAERFCEVVDIIEGLGQESTEDFWDYIAAEVHNLAESDDFGMAVWGIFLGIPRPTVTVSGITRTLGPTLYRKVLVARARLLSTNGSLADIAQYCANIFGDGNVRVVDGLDMSISYSIDDQASLSEEETALFNLGDYWKFYPAGVRDNTDPNAKFFAFGSQHAAQPSGSKITSGFGRSVFHPKTRVWRFYDIDGVELEGTYEIKYESDIWVLTTPTGDSEEQYGRNSTRWSDYGVYFTDLEVMAIWQSM